MAATGIGWAWNWSVQAPYPAIDAVKYCVELGNDVNAADTRGYTALHGAAFLGDNDMVNYLASQRRQDQRQEQGRRLRCGHGQRSHEIRPAASRDRSVYSKNWARLTRTIAAPINAWSPPGRRFISYRLPISPKKKTSTNLPKSLGFESAEYHVDARGARPAPGTN